MLDLVLVGDATAHQDDAPVGDAVGLGEVVGDPQDRHAVVGQRPTERLEALGRRGVERRGGLVHQQHLGLGDERAGQARPLGLATGERVGVAVDERRRQPGPVEGVGDRVVAGVGVGHQQVLAHGAREDASGAGTPCRPSAAGAAGRGRPATRPGSARRPRSAPRGGCTGAAASTCRRPTGPSRHGDAAAVGHRGGDVVEHDGVAEAHHHVVEGEQIHAGSQPDLAAAPSRIWQSQRHTDRAETLSGPGLLRRSCQIRYAGAARFRRGGERPYDSGCDPRPHRRIRARRPRHVAGGRPEGAARPAPRRADLDDARGHRRQAAVHRGRPRGPDPRRWASRPGAVRPWPLRLDVHQPGVDAAPVRRLLHGRGVQRLLPPQPGCRPAGSVGGLRPGHPPGLRLGPPPRGGRRRQGRRGHRLGRGHEDPLRRHPAGQDVGVDDHERRRAADDGQLHRRRRGAGRRPRPAVRDHPERHPQGVHGPEHLHLPAGALHADRRRHHRLHGRRDAPVQLDLDLRLPHAGGGGHARAGAGVHHRRRHGVRAGGHGDRPRHRRLRPPPELLLLHRAELLRRDRQAAGRPPAVGPGHEGPGRQEPQVDDAAHPLPDLGRVAHRAGPVQQRRAHRVRGHVGGARRHPVAAHQRLRRGARPAHRLLAPASPATPS